MHKLVTSFCALLGLLFLACGAWAAESTTLPTFDYKAHCKGFAKKHGGFDYLENLCLDAEQNSINYFQKHSPTVSPEGLKQCMEDSTTFGQSYLFMSECLRFKSMQTKNATKAITSGKEKTAEQNLESKQIKGNEKEFVDLVYKKAYPRFSEDVRKKEISISLSMENHNDIILRGEFLRLPKSIDEVKIFGNMIVSGALDALKEWEHVNTNELNIQCNLYKSQKISKFSDSENFLGTVKNNSKKGTYDFTQSPNAPVGIFSEIDNNEKKFLDSVFKNGFTTIEKEARKELKLHWKGKSDNNIVINVEFLKGPKDIKDIEAVGDLTLRGIIKTLVDMGYSPATEHSMGIHCLMYKSVKGLSGKPMMRVYGQTNYRNETDSAHFQEWK